MCMPKMNDREFRELVQKAVDTIRANDPHLQDEQADFDARYIILKYELGKKGWKPEDSPLLPTRDLIDDIVDIMMGEGDS